jgi:hypothetical protein
MHRATTRSSLNGIADRPAGVSILSDGATLVGYNVCHDESCEGMTTNEHRAKQRSSHPSYLSFCFVLVVTAPPGDNPATPSVITFIGWGPATQRIGNGSSVFGQFSQKPESVNFRAESMTERLGSIVAIKRKSSTPDVLHRRRWPSGPDGRSEAVSCQQVAGAWKPIAERYGQRAGSMPLRLGVLYYRATCSKSTAIAIRRPGKN